VHPTVREFQATQLKKETFDFRPGDTVRVSVRISEGGKDRIQDFEGICLRRHGGGTGETFTVRRVSYGVGMERVFPLHAPRVEGIRVVRRGKVRRANLTYLRARRGKKARITEDILRSRRLAGEQAEAAAAAAAPEAAGAEAGAAVSEAGAENAAPAPSAQSAAEPPAASPGEPAGN